MADPDPAALLYRHAAELLACHEGMLADAPRNRPFYRALRKTVTPDSTVLDIGAGSGVWAVTAARLGARKVVAVERDGLLAGLIKALARENGVADRVEVVVGDSRQAPLGRDFDVIVSETIGHLAFEEEIIPTLLDARERFLKPDGVLIPSVVALRVGAARLRPRAKRLPAGVPGQFGLFESLLLHVPLFVGDKSRLRVRSEPRDLVRVDLTTATGYPDFTDLAARWPDQDVSGVNGFAVWAEATLAEGVELTTAPASSWYAVAYRVRPFRAARGDLEFRVAYMDSPRWTATLTTDGGEEAQSYSPAAAGSALLAARRTDADVFRLLLG